MNKLDIKQKEKEYGKFGLEENPFPYSPVPPETPQLFCGQEEVSKKVSETISSLLSTGKSNHLVITGKYGNGKSHTLKFARSTIKDLDDVLVGYVAQPGEGFIDIYHEFIYDLGLSDLTEIAYEYLSILCSNVTDYDPNSADEVRNLIDDGDILLSNIVPKAIQDLQDKTKFTDFSRAFLNLIYEEKRLYAWQWLSAEGLRYEQRKEMEIHSSIDDDLKAVRAFTSLKNILIEIGYMGMFLFIDELESIERLSAKNKQYLLNSLRHLIDQNENGLCMMFACAPEVWQDVMSEYHAFSERIGQEVALKPLEEKNLYELINEYLNTAREKQKEDIFPFTEDCLSEILKSSQGNIRQVLSICSKVIDFAIEKEKKEIGDTFIKEKI